MDARPKGTGLGTVVVDRTPVVADGGGSTRWSRDNGQRRTSGSFGIAKAPWVASSGRAGVRRGRGLPAGLRVAACTRSRRAQPGIHEPVAIPSPGRTGRRRRTHRSPRRWVAGHLVRRVSRTSGACHPRLVSVERRPLSKTVCVPGAPERPGTWARQRRCRRFPMLGYGSLRRQERERFDGREAAPSCRPRREWCGSGGS